VTAAIPTSKPVYQPAAADVATADLAACRADCTAELLNLFHSGAVVDAVSMTTPSASRAPRA